ncbi:hypothetical protein WJX73_006357 [Symbiochloris irregularis]|uniref:Uncharacterized protein n=1 Tax=Symbiochloris irregularis TaxID=706552 RepID=A0AAW1PVQ3_9CHLO
MSKETFNKEASWHDTVRAAADACNREHERGNTKVPKTSIPLKDDVIPFYRKAPGLCYLDWHIRFWAYFDSTLHGVAWYASVGFYIGSYLFIIGSFAAISPVIIASATIIDCGRSAYDILVNHLFLIGTIIWTPACYCQMCDAANHGQHPDRV